jgi:hypothetical protein
VDFVIPATGAARSAFESVVTAAWMVAPDDAAERDRRWLALFVEERSYWKRMVEEAKERKDTAQVIADLEQEHARADQILAEVKPQFDAIGSPQPEKLPTMDLRLEAVQRRHLTGEPLVLAPASHRSCGSNVHARALDRP